jgi:hypothetical protein
MYTTSTIHTGSTTNPTWNGAICQTCSKGHLGMHTCSPADLLRKAADLIERARQIEHRTMHVNRTASCPCRPENGGSGVCGCVLGGPQITC